MPASKAQQKAVSKYMKENYDVYQIRMPKGRKSELQKYAAQREESLNGFINRAINEAIARDGSEKPADTFQSVPGVPVPPLQEVAAQAVSAPAMAIPPEKLNQAKAHAEARRESIGGFLARAIDETIERDKNAPAASQGDSEG